MRSTGNLNEREAFAGGVAWRMLRILVAVRGGGYERLHEGVDDTPVGSSGCPRARVEEYSAQHCGVGWGLLSPIV